MTSSRKIVALALLATLLAGAGAAQAALPAPAAAGPSCSAESCSAELREDIADAVETMTVDRPIDAPFAKAWLGAGDGDVTLVVFADYACPACRDAQPAIDSLIAADPRLKIVYPILVNEENGRQAALTSLAVAQLAGADWGKFHHALDAAGDPTAATIAAALKQAAIDPKRLPDLAPDGMADSPLLGELIRNDQQIQERKGTAVPAWVIADGKALNGFELPVLQAAIAAGSGGQKGERQIV